MNPQNQKPRGNYTLYQLTHTWEISWRYSWNIWLYLVQPSHLVEKTKHPNDLAYSLQLSRKKKNKKKHTHDSGTQLTLLGPGKETEQRKQSCRKYGATLQDILQPYNFITNYKNITIPCNSSKACFLCSSFPYWMKHWITRVESCAKAICRQTVGTF